jgi:hypothetical protein
LKKRRLRPRRNRAATDHTGNAPPPPEPPPDEPELEPDDDEELLELDELDELEDELDEELLAALNARVLTPPDKSTLRIAALPVSATRTLPFGSTATD